MLEPDFAITPGCHLEHQKHSKTNTKYECEKLTAISGEKFYGYGTKTPYIHTDIIISGS
jgi:hypothetical protein